MQKRGSLKIVLLFLIVLSAAGLYLIGNNTSLLTGRAASQTTNVSVFVSSGAAPNINITSPRNGTYFDNESIKLEYQNDSVHALWYKIDSGSNITLSSNSITLNISPGSHSLFLYANNTYNTSIKNVNFTFISERHDINYTEFRTNESGNSTRLNEYLYEELQNLTNLTFENISSGKIFFTTTVNLTNDLTPQDNFTDIDSNIRISNNLIEINSTALPNLNRTATLTLYGLTLSNPIILRDGSDCSSAICVIQSYSSGTLIFNVTSFSTYSATESATETPSTSTGGGGGVRVLDSNLRVSPDSIAVNLKQGEYTEREITLQNIGGYAMSLNLEIEGINELSHVVESKITINSLSSKKIKVRLHSTNETPPGFYIGKLVILGLLRKEIPIAISLSSKNALFDTEVIIPDKYLRVTPGERIVFITRLKNLGEKNRQDISLSSYVLDSSGNKIVKSSQTLAVETILDVLGSLKIPETIAPGTYYVYSEVDNAGEISVGSHEFEVVDEMPFSNTTNWIIALLIVAAFLILISITKHVQDMRNEESKDRKVN